MFKKKAPKEKEEDPSASSSEPTSYGGQPDVGGGADTSGKGGIIDKFSAGRRRLKENIAQKTGKEGADNSEFAERAQRVTDLKEKVTKVRDAMKRQLDCSRALCLACADLGNACSEAQVRDVQFQNVQYQLDEDIRKKLDDSIVKALESLENKLTPFGELVKMVQNRNKLKLDYDHYLRKVRELKEKPGSDVAKLSNNEAKLTAARQRLQEATGRLYKGFGYYDAVGGKLCQPEIEMFKKAQQDFFGAAMEAVKGMTARDPRVVASEVEAVGKDGMNAPFTLPASEHGSQGGGGLSEMGSLGSSMRDLSREVSRDDSPDRSPSSAYTPSSSAPWMTGGTTGGTAGGGIGGGSRSRSYKSPTTASGSSWWDKHAAAGGGTSGGVGLVGMAKPPAPPSGGQPRAKVLYDYTAADNTELSLKEGEMLTVVTQDQSGWWTGEKGGRRGLFPSNYVSLT